MEKIIFTLIIAGIGGVIGIKLKIPAGALIGAMIAVAIFNISTGKGSIPKNFKLVAQIVVGGMIGLNFSMETIYGLKDMVFPATLLVIGFTIFSLSLGFAIHKLTGLDLMTALFSTSAGGLTDMTLISEAYGAETPKVAIMHSLRLISVIAIIPVVISAIAKKMSVG